MDPRPDVAVPTILSPPSPASASSNTAKPADREAAAELVRTYQTRNVPVKVIPQSVSQVATRSGTPPPQAGITSETATGKTNWHALEARTRETLRVAHYSYRTEQTYLGWIRQFVTFHQGQKPSTMEAGHVRDFLRYTV